MYRGVVLFKRKEGEHELTQVTGLTGASWTHLPVGRPFAVKKGQVTVLGLMLFLKLPEDPKAFRVVAFDNRDETMDYLRRLYPAVLAGHDSATIVMAPGEYLR